RNNDIYGTMAEDGLIEPYHELFERRVMDTLESDIDNLTTVRPDEVAIFELMVQDAAYCRVRLETLLQDDLSAFEPVIEASLADKLNQHAARQQTADAVFAQWPEPYRRTFRTVADAIGRNKVREAYRFYGYDLDAMLTP